jgi:hypothetical protein
MVYEGWMLGASTKLKSLASDLSGTYTYEPTDSTTGKYSVETGDRHFGGTDSPLSPEQQREMPNAWGLPSIAMAVAVGFHLPNVGGLELRIPREALAAIFLGRIRRWSELAEWNPKLENVRENIELVVRADKSVSAVVRLWHAACCTLHVARCFLHVSVARCVSVVARCLSVVARCLSVVARCLLNAAFCTLHVAWLHVSCCMFGQVGCH